MRLPAAVHSLKNIWVLIIFAFLFQSPFNNIDDIQAEANMWAIPCNGEPECGRGEDENPLICSLPEELTALSIILVYLGLFLSMFGVLIYKFGK